jgi:hypothetical protein
VSRTVAREKLDEFDFAPWRNAAWNFRRYRKERTVLAPELLEWEIITVGSSKWFNGSELYLKAESKRLIELCRRFKSENPENSQSTCN